MRYSQSDIIGLAILKKLEEYRIEVFLSKDPDRIITEHAIRVCEAHVANFTQFQNRASWIAEIQSDHEMEVPDAKE
jgi:hypothetical protein